MNDQICQKWHYFRFLVYIAWDHLTSLLYIPTQICFLIGGECITCCGSTKEIWLAHDQLVLLETAAYLWACRHKSNDFFTVFLGFELEGITKHLMTGPARNSEFCFPRGQSLSAYCLHGFQALYLRLAGPYERGRYVLPFGDETEKLTLDVEYCTWDLGDFQTLFSWLFSFKVFHIP